MSYRSGWMLAGMLLAPVLAIAAELPDGDGIARRVNACDEIRNAR